MKRLHAGLWLVVALCFAAAFGAGFAIYLRPLEASRNSAGTYSPTAGIPVVTHSTISSSVFNNLIADIGTEITNSVDKGGRTTMTAQLPLYNGTSTSPSFGFASETTAGLYRVSSGIVAMTFNGTESSRWTTNGIRVANGAVATPSLSFANDTGSGLYRGGSNDIRMAINGADAAKWTATAFYGYPAVAVGSNATPPTFTTNGTDLFINAGAASQSITLRPNGAGSSTGEVNMSATTGLRIGATGTPILASYRGTATWSPGSISAYTCASTTIGITGAAAGADCLVTQPNTLGSTLAPSCNVTSNTCNLYLCNGTNGAITPSSGTYACRILNP